MTPRPLETRMADAIRMLAVDAVEQARSGHPGAPMGMADIAVALWGSRPLLESLGIRLPAALASLMDRVAYAATPEVLDQAAALIPEELVDACSIAGTADECARRLHALAERGFGHLALWPFAPSGQDVGSVVDRLVTEVIPRVGRRTTGESERNVS